MQTVTVIDRGPPDQPYDEPLHVTMATVDAKHACEVDPDRYSMEPIPAPVPNLGLEDRITLLERRVDALESVDHPPPPVFEQGMAYPIADDQPKALSPKAKS